MPVPLMPVRGLAFTPMLAGPMLLRTIPVPLICAELRMTAAPVAWPPDPSALPGMMAPARAGAPLAAPEGSALLAAG